MTSLSQQHQSKSSTKAQVERADLVYAAEILDAKERQLDEREKAFSESVLESENANIALDANIAHKKALLLNLDNQTTEAQKQLESALKSFTEHTERIEDAITDMKAEEEDAREELDALLVSVSSAETQLNGLEAEIENKADTAISLESRIIELKQQAQLEQSANATAVAELSTTISDLIEQRNELERVITTKKDSLKRLEIKLENAEKRHNSIEEELEAELAKLEKRRSSLSGDISAQETKLGNLVDEQTRRMTMNITKEKELQIREAKLDEWAKELGYKERKIQSDLSLR